MSMNRFFLRSSSLASHKFTASSKALLSTNSYYGDYNEESIDWTIPLPSERASNNICGQGWFIDTTVKASPIPGAGRGR